MRNAIDGCKRVSGELSWMKGNSRPSVIPVGVARPLERIWAVRRFLSARRLQRIDSNTSSSRFPCSAVSQFPDSNAQLLRALDAPNSRRKIRTKKPRVRGLVGEPLRTGPQAAVDGRGSIAGLFEGDPRTGHHCLVKGKPSEQVPFDEFANGVIVGSPGTHGCQAAENR
jgi:hypothetical protein